MRPRPPRRAAEDLGKGPRGPGQLHASTVMTIVDGADPARRASPARTGGWLRLRGPGRQPLERRRKLIARRLAETLQRINVREIRGRAGGRGEGRGGAEAADAIAKAHQEAQQRIASTISTASSGLSGIASRRRPVAGGDRPRLNLSDTIASVQEELMSLPDILTSIPRSAGRAGPDHRGGRDPRHPPRGAGADRGPPGGPCQSSSSPSSRPCRDHRGAGRRGANVIYAIILALPGIIQADRAAAR